MGAGVAGQEEHDVTRREGGRAVGGALADWYHVGNSRAAHSPSRHPHYRCEITLCTCLTHYSLLRNRPFRSLRTLSRAPLLYHAHYLANKCSYTIDQCRQTYNHNGSNTFIFTVYIIKNNTILSPTDTRHHGHSKLPPPPNHFN